MLIGFVLVLLAILTAMVFLIFSVYTENLTNKINQIHLNTNDYHDQYNQILSELAELIEERVEKQKFEIERQNAALIQKVLNTHVSTQLSNIEVFGSIQSANECSGDWWYSYEQDNRLYVWLGDVTGHGVAAAIMASACRSTIMSFEHAKLNSLTKQASVLNEVLFSMFNRTKHVTFRALSINLETFECEHINGSHPDFILKTNNDCNVIAGARNPPLGLKLHYSFTSDRLQLTHDFKVFLVTDGFLEISPKTKGRWNYRTQMEYFSGLEIDLSAEECISKFQEKVCQLHGGDSKFEDDITVVCLAAKRNHSSKAKAA